MLQLTNAIIYTLSRGFHHLSGGMAHILYWWVYFSISLHIMRPSLHYISATIIEPPDLKFRLTSLLYTNN